MSNNSTNKQFDKTSYNFGLWVSGEIVALYRSYDGAMEALEYLDGQGFDLAITNVVTNETLYIEYH